jgi:archaellum component FlaF (FlaF/FlaG flagellin family)
VKDVVAASTYQAVDATVSTGYAVAEQLAVAKNTKVQIASDTCVAAAHKLEEATSLAIDQVQAAYDTTIQIGQLAYNIAVERSAHAYDYATSTVKIATTAKDATLRSAFDNFNVVADKAMVAKDTTMEVVADACRLAADKATSTKATTAIGAIGFPNCGRYHHATLQLRNRQRCC